MKGPERERLLELYLDGELGGEECARFEREMEGDEDLSEAVALQRRIDGSLVGLFGEGEMGEWGAEMEDESVKEDQVGGDGWRRWVVRVAAVLVIGVGGWMAYQWWGGGRLVIPEELKMRQIAMGDHYRKVVAGGFEPDWVCETEKRFWETFGYRLGQKMLMRETKGEVEMVGMSYAWVASVDTVCVLLEVKGRKVIVYGDRVDHAGKEPEGIGKGLVVRKRVVGQLVLWEVSDGEGESVLERFFEPTRERRKSGGRFIRAEG